MESPVIYLKNIFFRRKDHEIISDVSWRIESGQNWALLGANGSGKTTLLKIVTGYEWPSSGEVRVLGEHFGECSIYELRKTIGWVSSTITTQVPLRDSAVRVAASGIDSSIGLHREFSEEEFKRARKALEMAGGSDFADQQFGTLSQGEQQKTLLARSLVNRPRLIVLDEPCIGLDPAARENFLRDIGNLSEKPDAPGIIYVTHHIEEIFPRIDHVLILKDGGVLESGRKEKVICSEVMSRAFDCECRVQKNRQRYQLNIHNRD
jgi:iron complex transport system ATP-binding protein